MKHLVLFFFLLILAAENAMAQKTEIYKILKVEMKNPFLYMIDICKNGCIKYHLVSRIVDKVDEDSKFIKSGDELKLTLETLASAEGMRTQGIEVLTYYYGCYINVNLYYIARELNGPYYKENSYPLLSSRENDPNYVWRWLDLEENCRPHFPGGKEKMDEYLIEKCDNNTRKEFRKHWMAYHFIVEKDGTISDLFLERGEDFMPESEYDRLINVVKSMPKWVPGKRNGKPVRTYYRLLLPKPEDK